MPGSGEPSGHAGPCPKHRQPLGAGHSLPPPGLLLHLQISNKHLWSKPAPYALQAAHSLAQKSTTVLLGEGAGKRHPGLDAAV